MHGATPKMELTSTEFDTALKSFKQHCQFWFAGPLTKASEAQNILYENFEKHVKPRSQGLAPARKKIDPSTFNYTR